jgi:hypothetical protein
VNKDRVLQKFRSVMILLDSFVYRKHRPNTRRGVDSGILRIRPSQTLARGFHTGKVYEHTCTFHEYWSTTYTVLQYLS